MRVFSDESRPANEREKKEKSHEHIRALRDPGNGLHLHRVRNSQGAQESPNEEDISGVQNKVDPMVAGRTPTPEPVLEAKGAVYERKISRRGLER